MTTTVEVATGVWLKTKCGFTCPQVRQVIIPTKASISSLKRRFGGNIVSFWYENTRGEVIKYKKLLQKEKIERFGVIKVGGK